MNKKFCCGCGECHLDFLEESNCYETPCLKYVDRSREELIEWFRHELTREQINSMLRWYRFKDMEEVNKKNKMNVKEVINIFDNDLREISTSTDEYYELVEQYSLGVKDTDTIDDVLEFFDEVLMEISDDKIDYNLNKEAYKTRLMKLEG